jgi:tripartite-type tricarboxylate transporter receptor subunit TctC
MTFTRKQFLNLTAGAVSLAAVAACAGGAADAEAFPSRPVKLIVGLPPGNSPDIVARLICQYLAQRLGQAFVVENRPGAATGLATDIVVHSEADGYTLLLVLAGNAVNGWVYKLNYDFIRDIAPVASIGGIPLAMVVTPSLPVKTIPEFIAYAKAHRGKLLMGSSGNGSLPHILGAMFAMMAGVELVHVPYRQSVFPDLLAGRVQVVFEPVPAVIGYIKAGELRPLGVSTKRRIAVLPAVPTIGEFLPGYEGSGWLGVGAPAKTPPEVVATLHDAVTAGLSDPALKERLLDLGVLPEPMSAVEFKAFIAAETEKWGKVVKFAHIKVQ